MFSSYAARAGLANPLPQPNDRLGQRRRLNIRRLHRLRRFRPAVGTDFFEQTSVKGNDIAYVSSLRDRQIVMVQLGANPQVIGYTSTSGSPIKTILNQEQTRLYVTEDFQDLVQVFDISNPLAMNLVRSISTK